ncbi:glycosyltransferase [Candidatus Paracaedibacter symbiosus]|uniref:glycosyltransferase n=1 Tax=Candidatus Paracaedibacter symbiosus TaxID=244582 RepID=UPI00050962AA|nr:glycosyltransferase [Candidatus Paracaedibacter symbiosus]
MKILLITEKCNPSETQRDGGARVVDTLQQAFDSSLSIMQFGAQTDSSATWSFNYPFNSNNRFERRIANASFIAEKIKEVEHLFTHLIFIHVSMQFGLVSLPLCKGIHIWTFPMFLTPSYRASGEIVPDTYFEMERLALAYSQDILTPSPLERRQLVEIYGIPEERIHVIPRGVDTSLIAPKVRSLDGPPRFCSIGSIKPQKDTLGLIQLFADVHAHFPGSTLRVIGPIQNSDYGKAVQEKILQLRLNEAVELTGHVPPTKLALMIKDAHLHLSMATCETFGRSIFETLASGLPNIARAANNAAAEYLEHLPYARFVDDYDQALKAIWEMLSNLSTLSSMALEIGKLYNEEILSRLLVAKIYQKDFIAVCDFDGTLFHKSDPEKTQRCMEAFRHFPIRVICSARPIENLLKELDYYGLTVDWIVSYGGAIVTNGFGEVLWLKPLNLDDVTRIETAVPQLKRIEFGGEIIQLTAPYRALPPIFGLRLEIYQNVAFIAHWEASKLHAVHQLLHHINWSGCVHVFGDGPYDKELLTYFDGTLITSSPNNKRQKKEVENV